MSFSNIIRLFRSFSKWSWLQARARSSVSRWYRWLRVWTPVQLTKYACVIDSEFPNYFFPIKLNIYTDRSLSTDAPAKMWPFGQISGMRRYVDLEPSFCFKTILVWKLQNLSIKQEAKVHVIFFSLINLNCQKKKFLFW